MRISFFLGDKKKEASTIQTVAYFQISPSLLSCCFSKFVKKCYIVVFFQEPYKSITLFSLVHSKNDKRRRLPPNHFWNNEFFLLFSFQQGCHRLKCQFHDIFYCKLLFRHSGIWHSEIQVLSSYNSSASSYAEFENVFMYFFSVACPAAEKATFHGIALIFVGRVFCLAFVFSQSLSVQVIFLFKHHDQTLVDDRLRLRQRIFALIT